MEGSPNARDNKGVIAMTKISGTHMNPATDLSAHGASGAPAEAEMLFAALFQLMQPQTGFEGQDSASGGGLPVQASTAMPSDSEIFTSVNLSSELLENFDDDILASALQSLGADMSDSEIANFQMAIAGLPKQASGLLADGEPTEAHEANTSPENHMAHLAQMLQAVVARSKQSHNADSADDNQAQTQIKRMPKSVQLGTAMPPLQAQMLKLAALARANPAPAQAIDTQAGEAHLSSSSQDGPEQAQSQMLKVDKQPALSALATTHKTATIKALPADFVGPPQAMSRSEAAALSEDTPLGQQFSPLKSIALIASKPSDIGPQMAADTEQMTNSPSNMEMASKSLERIGAKDVFLRPIIPLAANLRQAASATSSTTDTQAQMHAAIDASSLLSSGSGTGSGAGAGADGDAQQNLNQLAGRAETMQLRRLSMQSKEWQGRLVRMATTAMAGGQQQLQIQLVPQRLGRLNLQLNIVNDTATVQIRTDNPMAASMLGDAEAKLGQMMQDAGLRLSTLDVSSGQRFGTDQGADHKQMHQELKDRSGNSAAQAKAETTEAQNSSGNNSEISNLDTGNYINSLA